MALASSSQAQMRYMKEAVWGVTPTTGNPTELRMTGETLTYNITKDRSNEISADRQITSLAVTNVEAQGAINFELSYKEFDPFLAAVLMNNWVEYGTAGVGAPVTGTIDKTNANYDLFTATAAPAGPDAFSGLKAGQYVKIGGAGAGANAGFHQLVADGAGSELRFAKTLSAATDVEVTFASASLKIGNIQQSFTLEKEVGINPANFFRFTGMMASKLDLSFQNGSFLTGVLDFIGRRGTRADLTVMPGTPIESQTFDSMSSVTGVKDVRIGGVPVKDKYDTYVRELTLSFDNQLEGLTALGELGAVGVIAKSVMLGGSMSLYLSNGSLYDDFIASATNNFSFVVQDPAGNGYAFVLDKIDFNSMEVTAGGNDQAMTLETEYTGLKGNISRNSLTIYRL